MFASIRNIFRRKAQEKAVPDINVSGNCASLNRWLRNAASNLTRLLDEDLPKGPHDCYRPVDTASLTHEEIAYIAPAILALHDLCRSKNVRLEIDGFDRLPRHGVASSHRYFNDPGIIITVDTGQLYDHHAHPEFGRVQSFLLPGAAPRLLLTR